MPRASAAFSGLKRMWLASATWKMPSLNEEVTRLRKRRRNPRTRNRVHRARRKVTRHSVRSGASEPGQGGTSARQHALTSAPDRSSGQTAIVGVLPAPVGPEQAEALTRLDRQRQVVDRDVGAAAVAQVADVDGGGHGRPPDGAGGAGVAGVAGVAGAAGAAEPSGRSAAIRAMVARAADSRARSPAGSRASTVAVAWVRRS